MLDRFCEAPHTRSRSSSVSKRQPSVCLLSHLWFGQVDLVEPHVCAREGMQLTGRCHPYLRGGPCVLQRETCTTSAPSAPNTVRAVKAIEQ